MATSIGATFLVCPTVSVCLTPLHTGGGYTRRRDGTKTWKWIMVQLECAMILPIPLVLQLEYSWIIKLIPWLLMPWLLASSSYQQPWYWLCKIKKHSSRTDFEHWYIHIYQNIFSTTKVDKSIGFYGSISQILFTYHKNGKQHVFMYYFDMVSNWEWHTTVAARLWN